MHEHCWTRALCGLCLGAVAAACGAASPRGDTDDSTPLVGQWACAATAPIRINGREHTETLVYDVLIRTNGTLHESGVASGAGPMGRYEASFVNNATWSLDGDMLKQTVTMTAYVDAKLNGRPVDHGELNQILGASIADDPTLKHLDYVIEKLTDAELVLFNERFEARATCARKPAKTAQDALTQQ